MKDQDVRPGYVYHIKDAYFDLANDDRLMRNHEGCAYRPTYYCVKNDTTGLLWVIPMSRRIDKYHAVIQRETARYGKCIKIVIARYGEKDSAFLLQNMFPILPQYIDHVHTIARVPMSVDATVRETITQKFKEVLRLHRNGIKIVFPDIDRLEGLMKTESERRENRVRSKDKESSQNHLRTTR
jgi:hypothetical protein